VGKPEGRRSFERLRNRWKYNIEVKYKETGWKTMG
jgi:hypothetical protein